MALLLARSIELGMQRSDNAPPPAHVPLAGDQAVQS